MSKTPLVNQPTPAMSRKQFYTLMSAGIVTLGFWFMQEFMEIIAPPVIVGTVVGMVGAAIGYYIKDRANI